jgi:hypothetical protein
MGRTERTRRDYLALKSLDPIKGGTCGVWISYERMQTVAKRSLGHASECAFLLPDILQRPSAVFEGLRWDEDEDPSGYGWRCYCGIPSRAYRTDGAERPVWAGEVFLVFVNDEGIAYNWRWEKADEDEPDLPRRFKTRFKKRLI